MLVFCCLFVFTGAFFVCWDGCYTVAVSLCGCRSDCVVVLWIWFCCLITSGLRLRWFVICVAYFVWLFVGC